MKELNKNKSLNGNAFQNSLFEKYVLGHAGISYSKNNNTYKVNSLGKKISDIEFELASHPNIRIIFECTTSLRDDRYWAKEVQAKLIKDALKVQGKKCIYVLMLPDDTYYEKNSREIKNNKKFANLVNNDISKNNGIGFIDLMLRESDIEDFICHVNDCRFQSDNRIIHSYKECHI